MNKFTKLHILTAILLCLPTQLTQAFSLLSYDQQSEHYTRFFAATHVETSTLYLDLPWYRTELMAQKIKKHVLDLGFWRTIITEKQTTNPRLVPVLILAGITAGISYGGYKLYKFLCNDKSSQNISENLETAK